MRSQEMINRLLEDNEGNLQAVVDDLASIYRRSPATGRRTWQLSEMPPDLQRAWRNADEREKRIIVNQFLKVKAKKS